MMTWALSLVAIIAMSVRMYGRVLPVPASGLYHDRHPMVTVRSKGPLVCGPLSAGPVLIQSGGLRGMGSWVPRPVVG
jgi:hypothetical protein